MHRLVVLTALAAAVSVPLSSAAQQYPVKPVRIIVPLAAGGSTDNNGRMIAERLSRALGQPFYVENRPGAATDIGIGMLARSTPDGYTLGIVPVGSVSLGMLVRKLPYDPLKDLQPIAGISKGALVIVVNSSSPYKSLPDLIDAARKNPGTVSYGSIGIGSSHHMAGELLKLMTGADLLHVPFKGASEANAAVLAGQITASISGGSSVAGLVRAGRLRSLAVTNEKRVPPLPDVPAVGEYIPGYDAGASTLSLMAPAGTPRPIVDRLHGVVAASLKDPEVLALLAKSGEFPSPSTPEELGAELRDSIEKWTRLVKSTGLKLRN